MPKNLGGYVSLATLPFPNIFKESCLDCPWERVSNLKSIALTVLELLAFNAKTGLIDRSAVHGHTNTDTHTSSENSISSIYSIHLVE